jgi:hypothetical protein
VNLAARTVPLTTTGERLVLDVSRNRYRAAYYRPFANGREQRIAATATSLLKVLTIVFGEADHPPCVHDPVSVEHYIRNQTWGRRLP